MNYLSIILIAAMKLMAGFIATFVFFFVFFLICEIAKSSRTKGGYHV